MRLLNLFVLIALCTTGCRSSIGVPDSVTEDPTLPAATPTLDIAVTAIDALDDAAAAPPVLLEIPAIDMMHPVTAMEWEIADVDGERTTVWRVPEAAVGWHIDSARAGAHGNVILSGHQQIGAAVFKPIALGSVTQGQKILLTSESGQVFVYQVVEVSEPIPLEGATAEQVEQANQYYATSTEPRLTLITGWPDFTTTHRIFIVAQFLGQYGS